MLVQEKPANMIKLSEHQSLLVDREISELRERGAIKKAETAQEEFFSSLFLVGKKDEENRSVINLKKLDRFIPYEHFKVYSSHCRQQNDFLCNSTQQTVIKICEIYVFRQTLPISLPLFWFRASSKRFYQSTKKPNCSFETNKYSNNCLSGRYVADGPDRPYRKL